jgi:hypothetical protein
VQTARKGLLPPWTRGGRDLNLCRVNRENGTPKSAPPAPAANLDTSLPARNFQIPLAERIRAMGGPPAYIARKRSIEDFEAAFVRRLRDALAVSEEKAATAIRGSEIERLNKLIDAHNRYYPIEANLPVSYKTGEFMVWGEPWRPLVSWTLERLLQVARTAPAD